MLGILIFAVCFQRSFVCKSNYKGSLRVSIVGCRYTSGEKFNHTYTEL